MPPGLWKLVTSTPPEGAGGEHVGAVGQDEGGRLALQELPPGLPSVPPHPTPHPRGGQRPLLPLPALPVALTRSFRALSPASRRGVPLL